MSEINGRILELAWLSYRRAAIPLNASEGQLRVCRMAFYAGAVAALTALLEGRTEATDADLAMVTSIHDELEKFAEEQKPKGRPQ